MLLYGRGEGHVFSFAGGQRNASLLVRFPANCSSSHGEHVATRRFSINLATTLVRATVYNWVERIFSAILDSNRCSSADVSQDSFQSDPKLRRKAFNELRKTTDSERYVWSSAECRKRGTLGNRWLACTRLYQIAPSRNQNAQFCTPLATQLVWSWTYQIARVFFQHTGFERYEEDSLSDLD